MEVVDLVMLSVRVRVEKIRVALTLITVWHCVGGERRMEPEFAKSSEEV